MAQYVLKLLHVVEEVELGSRHDTLEIRQRLFS